MLTVWPGPPPPVLWNWAENWMSNVPAAANVIREFETIEILVAPAVLFSVIGVGVLIVAVWSTSLKNEP